MTEENQKSELLKCLGTKREFIYVSNIIVAFVITAPGLEFVGTEPTLLVKRQIRSIDVSSDLHLRPLCVTTSISHNIEISLNYQCQNNSMHISRVSSI